MDRLVEIVAANWLAIVLLAVAASAIARLVYRRTNAAFAILFITLPLSLGGLLLTGVRTSLFGYDLSFPTLLLEIAAVAGVLAIFLLLFAHVWSFWLGLLLAVVGLLGLGGIAVRPVGEDLAVAAGSVRDLEFVRPWWLLLLGFVPLILYVSRRSLSGLGPVRKWIAVGLRATIVALLAMALAEPRLRRASENVTVLFVVDRSYSVPRDPDPDLPASLAVDRRWDRIRTIVEESVRNRGPDHRNDPSGLILFGKRPKLALPPAAVERLPVDVQMAGPIDGNYTDIAAALKLALASFPEGTAKRIVLISDGNENLGRAEEQADLAKENGVEIDTIALAPGFRNENEVLVQAVEAPPTATQGARLPVRVLVRNANPNRIVDGRLELLKVGVGVAVGDGADTPVEIEDGPQVIDKSRQPPLVRLLPGLNVFRFRDRADPRGDSSFSYRATFTPTGSAPADGGVVVAGLPGDRPANNRAAAAVVARGQRRVLFLDDGRTLDESLHRHLIETLLAAKIRLDWLPAEKLPGDKNTLGVFLSNYDSLMIGNVPAERFSGDQHEAIRSAVYNQGCGLIMVGGPDSYGPGGYQQTPIEAALPVDCEIKALKAAGKGGLVLIMHASEMADGNKWQKDIAKLAIQRLGPIDMVGVTQYGLGPQGVHWVIPFQPVGETGSGTRNRMLAAIDRMTPGDMPDFNPFLRVAADTLSDPQHNLTVKHCILISDGDPNYSGPGQAAVKDMAANGITCTTVGVATHGGAEKSRLKAIAEGTSDGKGKAGNFYDVTNPNQLPAIYIKESRRVSQSFIYDKEFAPMLRLRGGPTDGLPNDLPPLFGFVRTTKKENPLVEMQIECPKVFDQIFPVLASWRYGLGKAVAFTSDARTVPGSAERYWDRDWVGSDIYKKFWEQVVNWSLREAERGRLVLVTEYRDGKIRVTADVRDERDKPVGGLTLDGKVSTPNPPEPGQQPPEVIFKPKGAGVYEAEFPAEEAGSYFVAVQATRPKLDENGKIVRDAAGNPVMEVFDAARAGVTVPYSPEFADLESNTPLMKRLAEITNGRFLAEDDPAIPEVVRTAGFFRPAPDTVRALLPFWFWLVFAAGVLLLFDVGVRRISLEPAEVRTASIRAWTWLRGWNEPEGEAGAGLDRLSRRKAAVATAIERQRAARRFDAADAPSSEPPPTGADEYAARTPTGPPSAAPPTGDRAEKPRSEEDDDPLSRLRKARDRARHRRDEDQKN